MNSVKVIQREDITMTDQKRFTLRIDNDILEKVKERAEENKRSMAKEIEFMLENYLKETKENGEN
jgi:hypothetical protein